jgi:hypothetical protein
MLFKTLCSVRVLARQALAVLVALTMFASCQPQATAVTTDASPAASTTPTATPAATAARPKLPPEPPPPDADLASEVPKLEAKLAADKAYVGVWDPKRSEDLQALLSGVSVLLSDGGFTADIMARLKARKLTDAAITLFMIHGRIGRLPDDVTAHLKKYLASGASAPHLGTWVPWQKGQAPIDFTSLAVWMNRDQPSYLRELLAARLAGPFRWGAQAKPPLRPYLSTEEALEWLSRLTALTPDESARLAALRADAGILKVPIAKLLADYSANEVRADAQYKGKTVRFSGVVVSIEKDFTDSIIVKVGATGAAFEPTAWSYVGDADAKKAATLSKGDHVSIRGRVDGLALGEVVVRNATIVP